MPLGELAAAPCKCRETPPSSPGWSRAIVCRSQGLPAAIVAGSSLTPGVSSRAKARSGGRVLLNFASDGWAFSSVGASWAAGPASALDSVGEGAGRDRRSCVISELELADSREASFAKTTPVSCDQAERSPGFSPSSAWLTCELLLPASPP